MVPAVSRQVNKEEEADENETEWLMEEIQLPAPRPGKEGQENGHVAAKSVRAADVTEEPGRLQSKGSQRVGHD